MEKRVLIIDDEFLIRLTMKEGLGDLGYKVETAETIKEGLSLVTSFHPQVVLLDNRLQDQLGIDHIEEILSLDDSVLIVMMTAYGSVAHAVEAMKRGAYDYILKPFDLDAVDIIIRRGIKEIKNRQSLEYLKGVSRQFIGVSPAVEDIRYKIKVLGENSSVDALICGETGTGKEVVSQLIHDCSDRKEQLMLKINCGAIPDHLFESELFGYEKGAFTGAAKTKPGLFEMADGGTVFLDEIGEMTLPMQAKLLRFLEDRKLKRVGGLTDIAVNTRIIAATNRNLEEEVKKGSFREDLFYRLNVVQIHIPPLRERREDIPLLCEHYVHHFNQKLSKNIEGIAPAFQEELNQREWKGNVRELKNVLEHSFLFCSGPILSETFKKVNKAAPLSEPVNALYVAKDIEADGVNLEEEVDLLEKAYIRKALELCDHNYTKAAERLGMTRFTLKRKLDR